MTKTEQIDLVRRYFAAVDGEDLEGVLSTLTEDCVFTVETHKVRLEGHQEVIGMFERLWANHAAVRHFEFIYVPDPETGRIATRFKVENTERDETVTGKSNCNFFEIRAGRFSAVAVYMAGPNTLD